MAVTIADDTNIYGFQKVKFTWVSATDGTASGATTAKYTGAILRAVFDPDAGGTQPTDQYDITITDANGYDVLNGNGADLSNAANVYVSPIDGLGAVYGSLLTLNVSNAGEAKGGVVELYIVGLGKA